VAYRLYTTYFRSSNAARQAELDLCLQLNCGAFDSVFVVAEEIKWPEWWPAGHAWLTSQRPTYSVVLSLAVTHSQPSDITIIANADIIFPRPTLADIERSLQPGEVWCLSRWDLNGMRLFDAPYSQDAWCFRGPPQVDISNGDFHFGYPGCDNRFAHELDAAGYRVLNPSRSIRTYHLHMSGHRPGNTAANRVPLPYLFVAPHRLGESPQYQRPTIEIKKPSQYRLPRRVGR
jgi:hypothetical protein